MATIPLRIGNQRRLETGGVVSYPDGSPIGQALEGAGDRGVQLAARYQDRNDERDNFKLRVAQQQLEVDLQGDLDTAATTMPQDGAGFHDAFAGQIDPNTGAPLKPGAMDKRFEAVRESLPESVRAKFDAIVPVYRKDFSNRAARLEHTARQDYYRVEVDKMLGSLETTVAQIEPTDRVAFDTFRKQGEDAIDATGLLPLEKETLRNKWRATAAEASWKAFAVKDPQAARAALGISGVSDTGSLVDRIIGSESGNDPNAKNPNSSATGLGQFTSSTWMRVIKTYAPELAQGLSRAKTLALRADAKISRAMTEFLVKENTAKLQGAGVPVNDGTVYLAHFAGGDGAVKVLRAVQAGFGHHAVGQYLDDNALEANPFLKDMTAADLVAWADKKMGGTGAPAGVDRADPRFQDIPLNRRIALVADAEQAATAARTDMLAQEKAQRDTQLNSLKMGIIDGKAGLADIQAARDAGWLTDADDVNTLQNLYETKNKDRNAEASVIGRISAGNATFDPAEGSDDRKAIDRLYERSVDSQALAQGNQQAATGLFGMWRETGVMPKKAKGDIAGMLRSQNTATITTALSYLDALERDRPDAFVREFDEGTEKALVTFRSNLDYYSPEEIADQLKQSSDPQHRRAVETLKKEIQPEVDKMTFDDISSDLDTSWTGMLPFVNGVEEPMQSEQRATFVNDFKTLLIDQYGESGNLDRAKREAWGRMQRVWGTSEVNGGRLMKLPPESSYPMIDQSHNWMADQLRDDMYALGLYREVQIEGQTTKQRPEHGLIADSMTDSERASGKPPSYQLWIIDDEGLPTRALDKDGREVRIKFDPAAANAKLQPERMRRRQEYLMNQNNMPGLGAIETGIPF